MDEKVEFVSKAVHSYRMFSGKDAGEELKKFKEKFVNS